MWFLILLSAAGGLVTCIRYYQDYKAQGAGQVPLAPAVPVHLLGDEDTCVARGDALMGAAEQRTSSEPSSAALPSALTGVSDEAWTRFVRALRTKNLHDVSASNALGMFEMRPRRLADLGIVDNLQQKRAPNGRMVWVGHFVPPATAFDFLSDPRAQYSALAASTKDYARRIEEGKIVVPSGMSVSGALAVLHRAGPGALEKWNERGGRFPETSAVFDRAQGVF